MDPWSFGSEEKGLLFSDLMDFPFDAYVEFMELGFTGTHFHENPKQVASPTCIITPNSSFGEVESETGLKLCRSIIECNSNESSLIDLKLGRLGDKQNCKEGSVLSSSLTTKRARTTTTCYSQTPFCQVQGCNMDLSSSKDYHRRHRVCVAHSKTSRVIVNGIEQRFCQQCSRFHLLAEFDDGKRSCRKRLAGHNERRRKPQLDSISVESHKFLQSIQDARFLGDSFSKRAPFVFPGGILYPDRYNQCRHIKFDECSPQSANMMNGPLLAKSFPRLHSINGSGIPPSNVEELSGSASYGCALSLLSTQSQGLLSYPAGNGIFQGDDVGGHISGKTFSSSLPNPIGIDHMMLPHRGSGFSNSKQPQQGTTVDLLQLSSRLQRVEQRRSSMQVKLENEDFFGFLTT